MAAEARCDKWSLLLLPQSVPSNAVAGWCAMLIVAGFVRASVSLMDLHQKELVPLSTVLNLLMSLITLTCYLAPPDLLLDSLCQGTY